MQLPSQNVDEKAEERNGNNTKKQKEKEQERLSEVEKQRDSAQEVSDPHWHFSGDFRKGLEEQRRCQWHAVVQWVCFVRKV